MAKAIINPRRSITQLFHPVNFGKSKGVIFLVDDDEDTMETLEGYFEDDGYLCMLAADGLEALPMMKGVMSPSVALVDLMMPGMDGFELIEKMKADRDLAHIPVVVLTGQKTLDVPGAYSIIHKPCNLEDLEGHINRAFEHVK